MPATRLTRATRFDRRTLLRVGGLGLAGLNLRSLLRGQAAAADPLGARPPTIRSCILVFYYGGPSHLDMWDQKPDAPREVRGEFGSIATSVPGRSLSDQLPHCARVMDRLAIIRSMHHPMRNHNSAAVEALCGRTPAGGDLELLANNSATDFPCYGSALNYLLPNSGQVPPHVALPHVMYNVVVLPGQTAGFLGSAYEPWQVTRDPNAPDFRISELELPGRLSLAGLEDRQSLLNIVDRQFARQEKLAETAAMDDYYQQAFSLLRSTAVREAFDINREHDTTRERYGRTTHGQSVLLARRLVESGVRMVCVYDHVRNGLDNWDTHVDNFGRLKKALLPPTDRAFAALVEDLTERGLLDSTLVIGIGEFGRTPTINSSGGRDHWPDCFSVVLAGGGVHGGVNYGSSDKLGAYPETDPVTPGDLAATIYWRFGLDHAHELHDGTGRPQRLAAGEPIRKLFG
ncbi:MAG: DUF1501 domain-containing protein [Planctomycetaceae bacterium]|nr:DUF1501 domain-containing protein [Planctomycetaceae bacterium]